MELFIVDSMLGKLAVRLRLLGFDTTYYHNAEDSFLLRRSREEGRLLLTHDLELPRVRGANAYFVVSRKLDEQIKEIAGRFRLEINHARFFTRCTVCNDLLRPIARERVRGKVPPRVFKSYDNFSLSPTCGRIYWKGSHYDRLRAELKSLLP